MFKFTTKMNFHKSNQCQYILYFLLKNESYSVQRSQTVWKSTYFCLLSYQMCDFWSSVCWKRNWYYLIDKCHRRKFNIYMYRNRVENAEKIVIYGKIFSGNISTISWKISTNRSVVSDNVNERKSISKKDLKSMNLWSITC